MHERAANSYRAVPRMTAPHSPGPGSTFYAVTLIIASQTSLLLDNYHRSSHLSRMTLMRAIETNEFVCRSSLYQFSAPTIGHRHRFANNEASCANEKHKNPMRVKIDQGFQTTELPGYHSAAPKHLSVPASWTVELRVLYGLNRKHKPRRSDLLSMPNKHSNTGVCASTNKHS